MGRTRFGRLARNRLAQGTKFNLPPLPNVVKKITQENNGANLGTLGRTLEKREGTLKGHGPRRAPRRLAP